MATVEETMLVLVSTTMNNNKFYHVILNDDDTVVKRWGRVGAEGTSSTERTGKHGYDRAVAAKVKKGYKPTNMANTGVTVNRNSDKLETVAKKFLTKSASDTLLINLVERLVKENAHQIMENSGGKITIDDSGVIRTPLGLVDMKNIDEARTLLSHMETSTSEKYRIHTLEEYLTLIPQKVGYKSGWHDGFLDKDNLKKQHSFLDQLVDSLNWAAKQKSVVAAATDDDDDTAFAAMFRMNIGILDIDSKEFQRVNKLYQKTLQSIHSSSNLKLKRIYTIEDRTGSDAYQKAAKELGNVKELWHGSKVSNVLSILTKGLFVPPTSGNSTIHVTGRMFGNGNYFSDESSKAANYSNGYWSGTRVSDTCFMFLADVVMGNEFHPTQYGDAGVRQAHVGTDRKGRKYNSINVKGGTCGVRNNEMIVWNTEQISLKYLCEFGA